MESWANELDGRTKPIKLYFGPILGESIDAVGIWAMKSWIEAGNLMIVVVSEPIEFWLTELLAKIEKSFSVDWPVVCVRELAQLIGILILFAWYPNWMKQNVVLCAYLKYLDCYVLEVGEPATFFDDAGCVLAIRADFDCFVSNQMSEW